MRTKTLVDTLTSFRVFPAYGSDFDGDVIPEAILVKNIIEEMYCSVAILNDLINYLTDNDLITPRYLAELLENEQLPSKLIQFKLLAEKIEQTKDDDLIKNINKGIIN